MASQVSSKETDSERDASGDFVCAPLRRLQKTMFSRAILDILTGLLCALMLQQEVVRENRRKQLSIPGGSVRALIKL